MVCTLFVDVKTFVLTSVATPGPNSTLSIYYMFSVNYISSIVIARRNDKDVGHSPLSELPHLSRYHMYPSLCSVFNNKYYVTEISSKDQTLIDYINMGIQP
jgi:hypothetical protein